MGNIADLDGLPDPFLTDADTSFQWIRVATDNTETDISGATASTYTLLAGELGKTIKVKVTFTDDGNTAETLTSVATATVAAGTDTTAPTVTSIVRHNPSSSPTNADTLIWRVTFSEPVLNVDTADFTVSGTTATVTAVSAAAGVANAYDVTASGGNLANLNATATLSFAVGQNITDAASNALTDTAPTGTNHNSYVLDNTAPTVTITGVPNPSSAAFTATFTFLEPVTGFAVGDITLGNATAANFVAMSTTVYTALITPTAEAAFTVDVAVNVATDTAGNGNTAAVQVSSIYSIGICPRTQQVRDAILGKISGVTNCALVTDLHLAAVSGTLDLYGAGIPTLQSGDFDGLSALTTLRLENNRLAALPSGVFDGLSALTTLELGGNGLAALPAGVFDDLGALTYLRLVDNDLTELPAGVFDGLSALTRLTLGINGLAALPAGVFDDLGALTMLDLHNNRLAALPAGVFDGLSALTELWLFDNILAALPAGVFDDLSALTTLELNHNGLAALPDGVFDDLSALTMLRLDNNSLAALPDGVFEDLRALTTLQLGGNPGAPFAPTAVAAPADPAAVLPAGGMVTLAGSAPLSGNPWGANVTYKWDLTNPAGVTVTFIDAMAATTTATIPAQTAGTVLTFTLTVAGRASEFPARTATTTVTVTETPTVTSIERQDPASTPTNADTLTWRVTFSEPVLNVDTTDFTVSGTTATVTAVSAAAGVANAYDVTASGGNLNNRNATVTLSFAVGQNITDAESNALSNTTPSGTNHNTYVLDNTAPTVTITGVPNPSSAAFTATFTFLEPVTGFAVGDITLGNATASNFAVTSTTVYTALITPTAEAAFTVDVAANVAMDAAGNGNTAAVQVSSTYSIGICPRTQQVRDAILGKISGVTNCALVTDLNLAAVSGLLNLFNDGITTLQSGDFDGLSALMYLTLDSNSLDALPAGVFNDLGALTELALTNNSLTALPAGVFDDLGALTQLHLNNNSLTALPAGVFDSLSALTGLGLGGNSLAALPAGVFDELGALTLLRLGGNSLAALPAGVFDDLSALTELWLGGNSLAALPAGVFDDLNALTTLELRNNGLTALPNGVFDDLTALTTLELHNNGLTALPNGVFEELNSLERLYLDNNALATLPDGVFEGLNSLEQLYLATNPGAPFAPTAVALPDDGTVPEVGGTVTLDGSDSGPWGANVTYSWALTAPTDVTVSIDDAASLTTTVTIPPLEADTELVFTLTVTGRGSAHTSSTGVARGADTATVTVQAANNPPTVANAIPDQSATAGTAFSYAFPDTTFNDVDSSDTLTYMATKADGNPLPTWLTFAATTRAFSGMPAAADVGTVAVKVTASDGNGGSVSDEFDIRVVAAHCTSNTNELWCATLTVGTLNDGGITYTGYASGSGAYGGLAPSTFTYRMVTIGVIAFEYDADTLYFDVIRSAGTTPADGVLGAGIYTLEIGTGGDKKSFVRSNPGRSTSLQFFDTGLSWSSGDTVPVKLVRAPNTAPTSADSTVTATEDTDYRFSASDFPFMDTDVGAEFDLVTILTLPASGTLTLASLPLTLPQSLGPTALDDAADTNDLVYTPPANENGDDLTSFTFSVYDGAVDSATHTLTIDVTAVDDAATGKPGITGTAQVGQTLTATAGNIADLDGLPDPFLTDADTSFQWIRVATDNTETDISGATASTYTLLAGELGKTIKVKVTFTDDGNTAETLTSVATATVAAGTDTTAPTVTSIVRHNPSSSPTNADTLIWRVTFSEPVTGVDAADFTVAGTTATATLVSPVTGMTTVAYDVTASGGNLANLNATATLSFAVGQNITDAASNALADTAPTGTNHNSYVLDNTAPTVTISGVPNPSSAAFTATFTFLEPVTGFAVGDITLGNATASNFVVTSTTVYTALITPTAEAAFTVDVAANVATDAAGNGNTAAVQVSSTYSIGICPRTQQVRDAILGEISGVTNCALVTDMHLAAVTGRLNLFSDGITTLQSGDFDGLSALTMLQLESNSLAALPDGVFDDLGALTTLQLSNNGLAALPDGVFDDLSALTELYLSGNSLTALPDGVFDDLGALTTLWLQYNGLTALAAGVFDDLGALTLLRLHNNSLAALPAGVFDDLSALTTLRLESNSLAALPDGVFEDLGALTMLQLSGNSGAPFAPTAVAAPANPATVLPAGGMVTLAGSAPLSGNPWGANVTYEWELTNPAAVMVTFGDAMAATTTATIPPQTAGTVLTFTLAVAGRASQAAARTATTTVTVTETPTVTLALSDASISENGAASTVTATVSPASATAFTVTVSAAAVSPAVAADFNLSTNKILSFATNATTSTGTVTITSVNNDVDAADKTVTVSGAVTASGVTAPPAVTLTIEDDDAAPTVANPIPDRSATVSVAFNYAFPDTTFTDTDGDTLTYMARQADDTALPTWLTFNPTARAFSGTPAAGDVGTVAVKVTASDGNGGSVSDTFNIVVSAAADTPPGLVTAQVDGETLTLTYNEALDTGSVPVPGDFSVSVNGNTGVVSDVALSGSALTLELAVTVVNTDRVTVTYTAGSNPIQDLAGNDAADIPIPGRAVDNVTVSAPGAPGSLTAIPGNEQVGLGWAPPSVTGGAAIVRYEYRVSLDGGNNWLPDWTAVPDGPDTGSDAADERAYLVTGLTNGTAYTFEVRASNSTHSGPAAQAEATPQTGPAADPDAPRGFAARAGDAAVTLSWQAPLDTGNRPLLRYEVRYAEGSTLSSSVSWQDAGAVLTYTVAGLTNGRQHTFEVRAVNTANRAGAAARAQATPEANANVPGPVRSLRAAARNFEVALYWHTPAREGLTAITHYEFRYARGSSVPTGAAWVRVHDTAGNGRAVDGLENGVAYTFEVRAVNATGAGALAQVRATPGEPALRAPGAPGNLRAVSGVPYVDTSNGIDVVTKRAYVDVTLSWDAPTDDGDDPIFRYETRYRAGSAAWTAYRHVEHREGLMTTVAHLTPGTRYTFEVRAVNEVGPGTAASRQLTTARYTGPTVTLQAGGSAREGEPFTLRATRSGSTAADTYVFFELYDSAFPNGYRGGTRYHHKVAYFNGATATASYTPPFDGTRAGRTFTVRISSVNQLYAISGGLVTVSVADRDAGLSVADASVREGVGATLEFVVRLDRARAGAVTVEYATSADTATAGTDYTEVSGTLSIPAGSRAASIEVPVLDDDIDDDGERLILTLSNADGAIIDDGVATGTIRNTDALPKAWLSRFGRSAAVQVVTLLDERFEAAAASDTRLVLGGRAVDVAALRTAAQAPVNRRANDPFQGAPPRPASRRCPAEAGTGAPQECDTAERAPARGRRGSRPPARAYCPS